MKVRRPGRSGENGVFAVIRACLPELVYGANDGVVTTLAIVAGVSGARLSSAVILILGFGAAIAGQF